MEKSLFETERTNEFQDEHLAVKATWSPGSQVSFDITVLPSGVTAAYKGAVKAVSKEVSLPGFRKGKAPESLIVSKYGKSVQEEWLQIVLKAAFNDALKLANLQPFNNDSIRCSEVKELSKEKGAKFTINFEASPVVPHIDLDQIHLHAIKPLPVSQKDIDQVLRNIQLYQATWTEIQDRPLQDGDFVDLDIENMEEPGVMLCENTRFEAKKGVMAEWMYKLLIGIGTNESVEGTSEKEEADPQDLEGDDDAEAPSQFHPTRCRLIIKSIKIPTLPELNDEFARKVGATSLEDLNARVTADIHKRANDRMRTAMYRQLDEQLLQQYRFDPPASLLEAEKEHRAAIHRNWLEQQGASEDVIEKEMQKLEETLPKLVDEGLRLLFLLLGFAKEHSLKVSQEELIRELSNQLTQGAQLNSAANMEQMRARIHQGLLLRHAREYMISHVNKKS